MALRDQSTRPHRYENGVGQPADDESDQGGDPPCWAHLVEHDDAPVDSAEREAEPGRVGLDRPDQALR